MTSASVPVSLTHEHNRGRLAIFGEALDCIYFFTCRGAETDALHSHKGIRLHEAASRRKSRASALRVSHKLQQ